MSEDMEFSEAAEKIAKISAECDYIEESGLVIMVFCNAMTAGETPRMALTFAKNSIKDPK